jgi:hypothetical protein
MYIGAMGCTGILYHKFVASCSEAKCGVDADNFWLFLSDLAPHLPESVVLLMDNTSIHTTEAVGCTMDDLCWQGFEVGFLPLYLLFLNPIEYMFLKIKGIVHHATFHNRDKLHQSIMTAAEQITASDAAAWFMHMVQFFHQCSGQAMGRPRGEEELRAWGRSCGSCGCRDKLRVQRTSHAS